MLETFEEKSPLRLIDFGLAITFSTNWPMTLVCGTLCYMAPEVLNGSYNEKCDVWSIGITIYYTFCNYLPFLALEEELTISDIQTREPHYAEKAWETVPDEAKRLLRRILSKDCGKRPTAR